MYWLLKRERLDLLNDTIAEMEEVKKQGQEAVIKYTIDNDPFMYGDKRVRIIVKFHKKLLNLKEMQRVERM